MKKSKEEFTEAINLIDKILLQIKSEKETSNVWYKDDFGDNLIKEITKNRELYKEELNKLQDKIHD